MAVTRYHRGGWRVKVYDPTLRRSVHVGITKTKAEGRKLEAEYLAKLDRNPTASTMTVAAWRARWVAEMRAELEQSDPRRRESTVIGHEQRTRLFAEQYGQLRLVDVTVPIARQYALAHRSHHPSLCAMFTDARLAGLLTSDDNPFQRLRIPRSKGRRDLPPDFLTDEKVTALETAAVDVHGELVGGMVAAFITLAVDTGLRRGELFALEHGDADLQAGTLTVSRAWNEKTRRIDVPKNGQTAIVVLGPRSAEAIERVTTAPLHPVLMFTSRTGRPLTGSGWHYLFDPVRRRAGVEGLTAHWFRHYTATRLVESGVSDYDVAQQLRHRDGGELVRTTYAHRDNRAALERVREALAGDTAGTRVPASPAN